MNANVQNLASALRIVTLLFMFLPQAGRSEVASNRVAVLDFQGEYISRENIAAFSERIRTEFSLQRTFDVADEGQIKDFLWERICADSSCALEAGNMLEAMFVVYGKIHVLERSYQIQASLIECQSGQVLETTTEDCIDCVDDLVRMESMRHIAQKMANAAIEAIREYQARQQVTVAQPAPVPEKKSEFWKKALVAVLVSGAFIALTVMLFVNQK